MIRKLNKTRIYTFNNSADLSRQRGYLRYRVISSSQCFENSLLLVSLLYFNFSPALPFQSCKLLYYLVHKTKTKSTEIFETSSVIRELYYRTNMQAHLLNDFKLLIRLRSKKEVIQFSDDATDFGNSLDFLASLFSKMFLSSA